MKSRWIRNEKVDGPGFFVPKSLDELTPVHPYGSAGNSGHSHAVVEAGSLKSTAVVLSGGAICPLPHRGHLAMSGASCGLSQLKSVNCTW